MNLTFIKAMVRPFLEKRFGPPRPGLNETAVVRVTSEGKSYVVEVFDPQLKPIFKTTL